MGELVKYKFPPDLTARDSLGTLTGAWLLEGRCLRRREERLIGREGGGALRYLG